VTVDEGYTKFSLDWLKSGPLEGDGAGQIKELITQRRPLRLAGLIGIDEDIGYGNMSARVGNKFIITGTQTGGLRELKREHFALVTEYSFKDNRVQCVGPCAASAESLTHASLYELDWAIRAVIHVHDARLWRGMAGLVPTTHQDVQYGTPEMAQEFRRLYVESEFIETGVAVMAGHFGGLISFGTSVSVATQKILKYFNKM